MAKTIAVKFTTAQARILRAILHTHGLVCVPSTGRTCKSIVKKLDAAVSTRRADTRKVSE